MGVYVVDSVDAMFATDLYKECIEQQKEKSCIELVKTNKEKKKQVQDNINTYEKENIEANKIIENKMKEQLGGTDFKVSF